MISLEVWCGEDWETGVTLGSARASMGAVEDGGINQFERPGNLWRPQTSRRPHYGKTSPLLEETFLKTQGSHREHMSPCRLPVT